MYGGAKYPRIFSRGYNILGGTKYPVTPGPNTSKYVDPPSPNTSMLV